MRYKTWKKKTLGIIRNYKERRRSKLSKNPDQAQNWISITNKIINLNSNFQVSIQAKFQIISNLIYAPSSTITRCSSLKFLNPKICEKLLNTLNLPHIRFNYFADKLRISIATSRKMINIPLFTASPFNRLNVRQNAFQFTFLLAPKNAIHEEQNSEPMI